MRFEGDRRSQFLHLECVLCGTKFLNITEVERIQKEEIKKKVNPTPQKQLKLFNNYVIYKKQWITKQELVEIKQKKKERGLLSTNL